MSARAFFLVDAFTSEAFRGNAAAVVIADPPLDDDALPGIAREMNQSETAFVTPRDDGSYGLRWLTPEVEVNLCGHATLAATHALVEDGRLARGQTARFHTRSGELRATVDDDGVVALDFPRATLTPSPIDPALVERALRADPIALFDGGDDLVVELASEAIVRALAPDLAQVKALPTRGMCVTARADPGRAVDFVSRFFAPQSGIDEDPVTGSAHCLLVARWGPELSRTRLRGEQCSSRGGIVDVEDTGERTILRGRAVTIVKGQIVVG